MSTGRKKSVTGARQLPRKSKQGLRHKDVQGLIKSMQVLQQNLSRLAMQTAQDIAILKEQNASNHELIGGLVEYVQTEHGVTEDQLLQYINTAIAKWKQEKLSDMKERAKPASAICEGCLYVDRALAFELDADKVSQQDLACPKCWAAYMKSELDGATQCKACNTELVDASVLATEATGYRCPKCHSSEVFYKEVGDDLQSEQVQSVAG